MKHVSYFGKHYYMRNISYSCLISQLLFSLTSYLKEHHYMRHLRSVSYLRRRINIWQTLLTCLCVSAPLPEFMLTNMDMDARLAHSYTSWGELVKRNQEKVSQQQERMINGLLFLRLVISQRIYLHSLKLDVLAYKFICIKTMIDSRCQMHSWLKFFF